MPSNAEKITGIYERKLIRKLLQTNQETNLVYEQFIRNVSPILAQYRSNLNGVIIKNPALDRKIKAEVTKFQSNIKKLVEGNQAWAWALSDEKNGAIIRDYIDNIAVSKIAGLGKKADEKFKKLESGLFQRNVDAFKQYKKRDFTQQGLSERIWDLSGNNKNLLDYYLENGLSTGRSAELISQDIRQLLNQPEGLFRRVRDKETGKLKLSKAAKKYNPGQGRYRSSAQNARRLARTETNMAYRAADMEQWQQTSFVLGFEVKLSNRHPAPDICDHAKGRYPKGFRFIGWHPQCLCYAVPILPDEDDFIDNLVNGTPVSGEVTSIPGSMEGYIKTNSDKISGWKRQPFWVQDNFRNGRIEKGLNLGLKKSEPLKQFKNGGNISVFPQVDKTSSDYKRVYLCAEYFAKKGKSVEILPKLNYKDGLYKQIYGDLMGTQYARKCPDLKVDGLFYEHEGFSGDDPLNSLRNMFKRGLKQSSRIIIEDAAITNHFILKNIHNRLREGQIIDEVLLIKKDGSFQVIYKKAESG